MPIEDGWIEYRRSVLDAIRGLEGTSKDIWEQLDRTNRRIAEENRALEVKVAKLEAMMAVIAGIALLIGTASGAAVVKLLST